LGQGIRDDALLEEAELIRFQPDGKSSVVKLNLNQVYASNPGPENVPLQPEDRLFIQFKPVPFAKAEATILGEVKLPGTFPIVEGKTKLSELVNMAGGFGPIASLTEAQMFRTSFASQPDETYMRLIESSPNSLRPEEMEYLKTQKRGTARKVSVDFVRLFELNDLTQDRVLRDEDSIYVPQPSMVVNVAGQVVRSGLVPYSEKMSGSDFVQEAGGFSGQADRGKIYVIKRGTGEWTRLGGKQKIEPGDTIWVPMKPDKSFWSSLKDVVVVVGSVATTYFVIDQAAK
jgi:protein involved in polysaccharide export with SLBB domain